MDRSDSPSARRLYFDNAATSFPKPGAVHEAMLRFATEVGASPGRGGYAEAREAARLVRRCRERVSTLINGESPDHVVFTLNTTDALNLAIKGVVAGRRCAARGRPVRIVTTWMDHNSVLRPYNALADGGVDGVVQTRVPCDPETGIVDPDDLRRAVLSGDGGTALVAVVHASNVSGTVQPVAEIGRMCRGLGVLFLVDAAQSLGHMPVDVRAMHIDLLAFPGHKGLLGPLGTGGLYIRPGVERFVRPVREGGTGSASERDVQPEFMPDRYEPGSHNTVGIIGLSEGVAWLLERGVDAVLAHERRLMEEMLGELTGEGAPHGLRLLGPQGMRDRVGVFSVVHGAVPGARLAEELERRGVLTRAGLHCAPLAHATFGTAEGGGATRLSLGPFLGVEDVREAGRAVREVCAGEVLLRMGGGGRGEDERGEFQ